MASLKAPPSTVLRPGKTRPMRMSEADFIEWSGDDIRAEWVDGEVEFMNAVHSDHADLTTFIIRLIGDFVEENDLGKIWHDPFQVRLAGQRRRRCPDIFFAFRQRLYLLESTQFNGSPDLVVEVISEDSKVRDRRIKFLEYQAAGVPEYWIVDPLSRSFDAYTLGADQRYVAIQPVKGTVQSIILPGLFFRTEWVWQFKFSKVSVLVKQMSRNRKKLLSSRKRRSSDNQP